MAGLIRIRAHAPRGYRLAGMRHGPDWAEHPAARFTAGQLEALRADPMLEVEIVAPRDGAGGAAAATAAPPEAAGDAIAGAGPGTDGAAAPSVPAPPARRPAARGP